MKRFAQSMRLYCAFHNKSERSCTAAARSQRFPAFLLCLILFAALPAMKTAGCADAESGQLEVHFLDVGEGDSAVIFCGGQVMMIDGGRVKSSRYIYSWLKQHSVDYIDCIVCTHPHEDHVGGLSAALNAADAGAAYTSVMDYDTKACQSFLKYLEQKNVPMTIPAAGETIPFGGGEVEVEVLGPVKRDPDNLNNDSLILRIVYGETSFLFMADAEEEEETDLLLSGAVLRSDVLKVGHHGSGTSTGEAFLQAVAPEIAVISVGDNTYGHPEERVLERLTAQGAQIFRTDECGEIVCISDGKNITVNAVE